MSNDDARQARDCCAIRATRGCGRTWIERFRSTPAGPGPPFRVLLLFVSLRWISGRRRPYMPHYFFHLRDGAAGVSDPEGVTLQDKAAARDYAVQVARELMSRCEAKRRHWQLDVRDSRGKILFSVPFVAADST